MSQLLSQIDWDAMLLAIQETIFMTFISLLIAVILGFLLGIILYITKEDGLKPNKIIHRILDFIVNLLRAVPFIILIFILLPVTVFLVGTMLGAKAALPALIISSAPFYARMCMIALSEVDKGTIEASKAMGVSNLQIITKVLLPEAKPALISSITVMGISLVGYTAMAGCIGAGGLGNLAYMYGYARQNMVVMYTATFFVLVIVFVIQGIGDFIVKKVDKR
ncbi:MAG: methionine ABC transporter permease [Longibaculum muris]|uniref:D-methionine transport system permease protein n=1 Tax=Longibaculum muris TaxID=1796628 RepID=A0A4R3ZB54_9FIRM|nr:methionine ABC transporter permease [Longibaculum muris]KXU52329.1 putative D-methionine transport system permease protein MetI [Candidatus Stoquefichus sp. KLE1796]MBS5367947.1 ABC transporter permease [Coprobacillus cateniformis]MCR1887172.1 ABC transporter permease [Longibaculum muris]MED9811964.1 methionine ABC transporter permease [Longibaculum muris]TCW02255.1 D-methionine transport system permease protein [Longibaculum muris]